MSQTWLQPTTSFFVTKSRGEDVVKNFFGTWKRRSSGHTTTCYEWDILTTVIIKNRLQNLSWGSDRLPDAPPTGTFENFYSSTTPLSPQVLQISHCFRKIANQNCFIKINTSREIEINSVVNTYFFPLLKWKFRWGKICNRVQYPTSQVKE